MDWYEWFINTALGICQFNECYPEDPGKSKITLQLFNYWLDFQLTSSLHVSSQPDRVKSLNCHALCLTKVFLRKIKGNPKPSHYKLLIGLFFSFRWQSLISLSRRNLSKANAKWDGFFLSLSLSLFHEPACLHKQIRTHAQKHTYTHVLSLSLSLSLSHTSKHAELSLHFKASNYYD